MSLDLSLDLSLVLSLAFSLVISFVFSLEDSLGATSFFTSFSPCTGSATLFFTTGAGVSILGAGTTAIGAAGAIGALGFSTTRLVGGLNSRGGKLGAL